MLANSRAYSKVGLWSGKSAKLSSPKEGSSLEEALISSLFFKVGLFLVKEIDTSNFLCLPFFKCLPKSTYTIDNRLGR